MRPVIQPGARVVVTCPQDAEIHGRRAVVDFVGSNGVVVHFPDDPPAPCGARAQRWLSWLRFVELEAGHPLAEEAVW